jgi:hypothetical protein
VFTARYALSPCIKQICFVFKGLLCNCVTRGIVYFFKLYRWLNCIKSSRADSHVSCIKTSFFYATDTAISPRRFYTCWVLSSLNFYLSLSLSVRDLLLFSCIHVCVIMTSSNISLVRKVSMPNSTSKNALDVVFDVYRFRTYYNREWASVLISGILLIHNLITRRNLRNLIYDATDCITPNMLQRMFSVTV